MKKSFSIIVLILLASISGCEKKEPLKTVTETTGKATPEDMAKKEVIALMDTFHNALKNKKGDDFKNLLDSNGLYCGTDPTEIYNRDTYAENMAEALNDPTLGTIAYTVDTREIRIDGSGTTATIMEQYKIDLFSPEIPWRLVSHAVKKDGTWIIDFLSFTLVPTNAQQEKMNKVILAK
ncbi:nuclear transport factor 2 family protein [Flavobacterium sp. DGU11]|uniref:Nuclear transport factor 2 family protein n=1 Tax=Flavobacterium arundinis TaxID=3139143 RepID=A0ABU9HR68_9FLAO